MKLADPENEARSAYSDEELATIVGVPIEQVRKWIDHGLLSAEPAGFAFHDLTRAQTLRDLAAAGMSVKKLRAELRKLDRTATPTACHDGQVLARLEDGELVHSDGQFHLDFPDDAEPLSIANPKSASDWYSCGIAYEADNDLRSAICCYRQALMAGGPDNEICFALAHALAGTGEHGQAAERYRQVIESDPKQADAWNNLGVALCELDALEEACDAFRHAVQLRPRDPGACFNLADVLDELGRTADARERWRAYLQLDRRTARAAHARRRVNAG